jgi:peptide/nickel transport system substrate-binding protein
VFGVFFNQTDNAALQELEVRRALDMSVNRDYIISTVLRGFGTPLTGPVPERFIGDSQSARVATSSSPDERVQQANALLDKAGWILNAQGIREKKTKLGTSTLAFAISTSDAKELKNVADILKSEWRKIGAEVDVKVFEGGNLNQNVIRPRKYDALLFGQIVNRDLDLYAFWHSSQRVEPGLNIALYTSPKADKILESLRTVGDKEARIASFKEFQTLLAADVPAVFLYSPDFIYMAPRQVKNIAIDNLVNPSERFNAISTWYITTDRVWKIFANR